MTKLVPLLGFPRPKATTGYELLEARYLPFLNKETLCNRSRTHPMLSTISEILKTMMKFEIHAKGVDSII